MATVTAAKEYVCPGEKHPISRSIHLARLAASFPACRRCPYREDARQIVLKAPPELTILHDELPPARELFTKEGVRGVYLNELTRALAEKIAASFCVFLWETAPVSGRNDGIDRGARQSCPTVVIGYDERTSSPSVYAGLAAGLRRTGCHVIDVGLATRPCFWFAVHHLHASGGLFVTGSGCEPSWTGIDFVGPHARPLSIGSGLERVRLLAQQPLSRPTRSAGAHRTFQAIARYEETLAKHFQDLRRLEIACACPTPAVHRTIERLFQPLPCRLIPVELPIRVRNPVHRRDADVLRLSTAVRDTKASLSVLIDDDGQRAGFVDERGRHVPPGAIARLVVPPMLAQRPNSTILLEPGALCELRPLVEAMGGICRPCSETYFRISEAMSDSDAVYAGGDSGRHWFCETFPTNDALLILAKVLAALSQANVPFSELAGG